LIASVAIACSIMGVRYFGLLQPLELAAFDRMIRSRPAEKQDPRLLVVTVDEESLKYQNEQNMLRQGSLSDRALILLLAKLKQYGARTIGLDIYRDAPPFKADIAQLIEQYSDRRLIVVCKVGEPDGSNVVAPPKDSSTDSHGFSDIVKDDDGVVRRQLLQMGTIPNSPCTTEYSLGLQLAARYLLDTQGIAPQSNPENHLQLGNIVFPRLSNHTSGYQQIDERGYQILLNYRSPYNQEQIAQIITLKQVLTGQINPESIKDRIVLIGVTDPSFRDYVRTPYSEGQPADFIQMPGVMLQAQMVSHILSAVLDRRPVIWVWAAWAEFLWVCGWAFIGGTLVWWLHRRPLHLILSSGASVLSLYGTCFAIFLQAGWIPFVPSALALISTGGAIWVWTRKLEIQG
jgi:CHASE2 domain-containing sensor protein